MTINNADSEFENGKMEPIRPCSDQLCLEERRPNRTISLKTHSFSDNKKPDIRSGFFNTGENYFTASFNAFPATKAGTLEGAIVISAPVCGLRPVRPAR